MTLLPLISIPDQGQFILWIKINVNIIDIYIFIVQLYPIIFLLHPDFINDKICSA